MCAKLAVVIAISLATALTEAAAVPLPRAQAISQAKFQLSKREDSSGATSNVSGRVACTPGKLCILTDDTDGISLVCNQLAADLTCDWSFQTTEGTEAPVTGDSIHYKDATYTILSADEPQDTIQLYVQKTLDSNGTISDVSGRVACTPGKPCTLTDDTDGISLVCNQLAADLTCDWSFQTTEGTEAPVTGDSIHYKDATYTILSADEPQDTIQLYVQKTLDSNGTISDVSGRVACTPGKPCTLTDDTDGISLFCNQLAADLTCDWSFQTTEGTEAPVTGDSIHYKDATYTIMK